MPASSTTTEPAVTKIVKAHAVDTIGTPQAFNYQDLKQACDEHLAAVREQSRRIITASAVEVEAAKKSAVEAGHKQGYQAGLKAAEADIAARVERLAAEKLTRQLETVLPAVRLLADRLNSDREQWLVHWEHNAVRLAVAIAEKLIRRTLSVDPTAADAMLSETLTLAAGSTQMTVRMSSVDLERLGSSVTSLRDAIERLGEVNFVADPTIAPGGCIVDTRYGRIDGRVDVMLERISAELIGDEVPIGARGASTGAEAVAEPKPDSGSTD